MSAIVGYDWILFSMQFLERFNSYKCIFKEKDVYGRASYQDCSREEICADLARDFPDRVIYDYRSNKEDPEYLNNWVPQLNMLCLEDSEIGLLGSAFFIGLFVGLFFFPKMGDLYGRKKIFILAVLGSLVLLFIMYYSTSFYLTMGCILLIGSMWVCKNVVSLSYAEEMLHPKYSKDVVTMMFFTGSLIQGLVPVIYLLFTRSWYFQGQLAILMTAIPIIGFHYMPESPKYLYECYEYDKAKEALHVIAKRNGVKFDPKEILFDREDPFNSQERRRSIKDKTEKSELFTVVQFRNNLLILILQWSCASFVSYTMLFYLKKSEGNIFVNSITISMANMLCELCGNCFVKRFGERKTFIISYSMVLFALGFLYVIQIFLSPEQVEFIMPPFLFMGTFGIVTAFLVCYTATFELFPLQERASALRICNLTARFTTIFAPLIAEIADPGPL